MQTTEGSTNQANLADDPSDDEEKNGNDMNEQGMTIFPNSSPREEGDREENDKEEKGTWIEAKRRKLR